MNVLILLWFFFVSIIQTRFIVEKDLYDFQLQYLSGGKMNLVFFIDSLSSNLDGIRYLNEE